MPQALGAFREWAARLSQPSVTLLIHDDHVVVQDDGEVVASGFLTGQSFGSPTGDP